MVRLKRNRASKKQRKQQSSVDIKEKLAQKRKAREKRRKLLGLVGFSLFFALLVGLPLAILVDPRIGIAVGCVIPLIVVCYQYPRVGLWAFLIYMPFSGTVTYWAGNGNAIFQLAKDGLYFPALLGLMMQCRRKRQPIFVPKQLIPTLTLLVICALLTLFLSNAPQQFLPTCDSLSEYEQFLRNANGDIIIGSDGIGIKTPCRDGLPFLQGLLGLKILLGYVPLIFCGYYLIEDKKKLLFFGRLLVILAIACCLLGLAQYAMLKTGRCAGTDHLGGLALFKPTLDAKCLVGGSLLYSPSQGQIRLPGTFVSPWHWAWFLVANAAICFSVAFSDTSFLWRNCGLVGLTLVFLNAIICGQRLALAAVPGMIILMVFLTGQVANLKRVIPIGIVLSVLLVVGFSFLNPDFVTQRIDSLVGRWNNSPPHLFVLEQFRLAWYNQGSIFGRGLGQATLSARIFGRIAQYETFHPKLIFEMGAVGLIAFMIFVTHLCFLAFRDWQRLKDTALRSFASGFWVFIFIISYFPYWYPLDTDPVAVYYWLFAGVIFKLPQIDKEEQAKLKAEKAAADAKKKRVSVRRPRRTSPV